MVVGVGVFCYWIGWLVVSGSVGFQCLINVDLFGVGNDVCCMLSCYGSGFIVVCLCDKVGMGIDVVLYVFGSGCVDFLLFWGECFWVNIFW